MDNLNPLPPDDAGALPEMAAQQAALKARCQTDILFWINHYGKTYDPRAKQSPHLDFKLYPFQERFVKKLVRHIEKGEDLLVEKSRDMGVSWLVLLVFQWYWLFQPGSNFLLGSRKMDAVDRLGDMSTLMEKLRYNLALQPDWLMPQGFQKRLHNHHLKLINPENGNSITGESSNANFARGGRYKAIFMDEFAYWQNADMAYASAGQSAPCRIVVSTPHGRANKFAQLRFESPIQVETLHWRQHPLRDERWYLLQKARMTEDELARELDINYNMSCRDRVFREFNTVHKRPLDWNQHINVIRSWDFGYHSPAVLFLQIDPFGRMLVLHEIVGERVQFKKFIEMVLADSQKHFPGAKFEDYADPAGNQRSDKSEQTNIEMLNQVGIYPCVKSHNVFDEVELLRNAFSDIINDLPGLIVDERCRHTIAALEGGYRFRQNSDSILEEHPYEDVIDCLRYAASHKLKLNRNTYRRQKAKTYIRPIDPMTGY